MIIRIVKMTFDQKKVNEFLEIFNSSKQYIRNFKGCTHLELLNDIHNTNIFFTYSYTDTVSVIVQYIGLQQLLYRHYTILLWNNFM